jgi:hypothetical protein
MKRWALLTIGLYSLCLFALAVPLYFYGSDLDKEGGSKVTEVHLIFIPILVLVQIALLLIPVAVAEGRPIKRRTVVASIVLGAFPLGILVTWFFWSVCLMLVGEDATTAHFPTAEFPIGSIALFWIAWGILFWRAHSNRDPHGFTAFMTRWLLRGSILEMLVAIPSHIISRHRHECCAPYVTLFGLVAGLSIALLSFGPGLFFLFAKKIREKTRAAGT